MGCRQGAARAHPRSGAATEPQRRRYPIFDATLRAGTLWRFSGVARLAEIAADIGTALAPWRIAKLPPANGKLFRRQDTRRLLKNSATSRWCRFFASPRREEGAYPERSVTDEQRRRGEKEAQPGGRERHRRSGGVARSSQVAADMLLTHALPSSPQRSRATWLNLSRVS
jgi:nitroreductase